MFSMQICDPVVRCLAPVFRTIESSCLFELPLNGAPCDLALEDVLRKLMLFSMGSVIWVVSGFLSFLWL